MAKWAQSLEPAGAAARSDGLWTAQTAPASELQRKRLAPLRTIVPGLVSEGATLLIGRPKLGKSWLALDLAVAIAAGRATLGNVQPESSDVLYLGLDDGERRLQRRMAALLPAEGAWPARLTVATQWRRAHEDGIADIAEWCASVANPAAVVIDSLNRFRSLQGGESGQVYDAIAQLQRIARTHSIAVIIVHHERGRSGGNPLDTVAGLAAIGGIADTVLLLKRNERGAVLYACGRDIEDSETAVAFDRSSCRWTVTGAAGPAAKSDARAAVVRLLSPALNPMSVKEIAAATGRSRGAIDMLLHRMLADGEVERFGRGRYLLALEHPKLAVHQVVWNGGASKPHVFDQRMLRENVRSRFKGLDRQADSADSDSNAAAQER